MLLHCGSEDDLELANAQCIQIYSMYMCYCSSVLAILEWGQGSRAVPRDEGCSVAE